ncbi:MAG: phosphotransferase [Chloroflexia bacterium]|nr:phosphotransferase [Chloroflexia bacterium]
MTIDQRTAAIFDNLEPWIVGQRWYGDKSRNSRRVTPEAIAAIEIDGADIGLIHVTLEFTDDSTSVYFVPLVIGEAGQPVDALSDPRFLAWLGSGFDQSRVVRAGYGGGSRLVWTLANSVSGTSWSREPSRVLGGEQSNTSIVFGDSAIAKVFRKVQPGINPDSEIVSHLSAQGQFPHVPVFLGAIVLEFDDGRESIELAAVQALVPNQGDCWRWLPNALSEASESQLTELLSAIQLLGQRTGELHVALAASDSNDAFRPVPIDQEFLSALEERIGREVRHTCSMLYSQGACSHGESEALAASLLRDVARTDALMGTHQTRVHGDYHLGQVLRTHDDFSIIDFEGEPSRSMTERREKTSPLKDVAGMLRSIDYAVATANEDGSTDDYLNLKTWRENAELSFVVGYLGAVGTSEHSLVPLEPGAFRQSLDLFMIEKALYEVRYELDNRPDWVDIPLGALQRIAGST